MTQVLFNERINDARLEMEFEVGTHFVRKEPGKRDLLFEQTAEGREAIMKSKFGKLPKDSPWR